MEQSEKHCETLRQGTPGDVAGQSGQLIELSRQLDMGYLILIYKYDRNDSQLRFCCSATDRILKTPDKFFDQIVDIS